MKDKRIKALDSADIAILSKMKDIEMGHISSFVLHYDVKVRDALDLDAAFGGSRMKFASEEVENYIIRKSKTLPMSQAIKNLIQIDNGIKEFEHLQSVYFEKVHQQVCTLAVYLFYLLASSKTYSFVRRVRLLLKPILS